MPPSQSDEEWISTLREKAKADFTSFYLLRIVFRGQEHVKIGVASAHNVNDRAWTITDNRGRRLYFNVLLWMPDVVQKMILIDAPPSWARQPTLSRSCIPYCLRRLAAPLPQSKQMAMLAQRPLRPQLQRPCLQWPVHYHTCRQLALAGLTGRAGGTGPLAAPVLVQMASEIAFAAPSGTI